MPELPEVEGARRLVERNCLGKKIEVAIVAEDDKVIQGIAPKELQEALVGKTVVAVKRLGKHMWLELQDSPALLLHFGMTGGIVVKGVGAAHYKSFAMDEVNWPPRFCKIELRLDDSTQLAFCDSRRFARVRFIAEPEGQPPLSELGWDPLLRWPSLEEFSNKLATQRRAVKAVLLDQAVTAGVGNWVADEVLYQARIHPEQPAASLTPGEMAALHQQIREVCTIASDVEADADRLPKNWLFHVRWGKGSKTVAKIGGHNIDHITVGGRTSAYVPVLQKLSKAAAAAAEKKAEASTAKKAAAKQKGAGGKGAQQEEGEDLSEAADEEEVKPAAGAAPRASRARGRAAASRKTGGAAAAVDAAAEQPLLDSREAAAAEDIDNALAQGAVAPAYNGAAAAAAAKQPAGGAARGRQAKAAGAKRPRAGSKVGAAAGAATDAASAEATAAVDIPEGGGEPRQAAGKRFRKPRQEAAATAGAAAGTGTGHKRRAGGKGQAARGKAAAP